MLSALAHRALERDGLGPIRDKVLAAERLSEAEALAPLRGPRPRRARRARQPRARGPPRRPHLLQPQRPPEPHQRLRGDLQVLLVRAPRRQARQRGLHHVPRPGGGARGLEAGAGHHRGAHRLRAPPRPSLGVLPRHGPPHPAGLAGAAHQGLHRGRAALLRREVREDPRAGAARAHRRRPHHHARAAAPRSSPPGCAGRSATTRPPPSSGSRCTAPPTGWGSKSNATMLYGHIETLAERVDHMARLRELQDRDRRLPGLHPARLPPRAQHDREGLPQAHRRTTACAPTRSPGSSSTTSTT